MRKEATEKLFKASVTFLGSDDFFNEQKGSWIGRKTTQKETIEKSKLLQPIEIVVNEMTYKNLPKICSF